MRNLKFENILFFLKNCANLSCIVQPLVSEKGDVWVERKLKLLTYRER